MVGGGDSALQEALTLTNYAERVLLFHNGENFSAQHTYLQRVLDNSKITPRYQTVVEEILGDEVVTGVRVRDLNSGETSQIELAGLFVYVGLQPNTAFLRDVVKLSDTGHVPTDVSMKTELPASTPSAISAKTPRAKRSLPPATAHRGDRGVSVHQGDFSLVCCLTSVD